MIKEDATYIAKGITWDLSGLYAHAEDPRLDRELKAARAKAFEFVHAYKGKLNEKGLDINRLLTAIREYESIHEMGLNAYRFAYLYYSSNTQDHMRNSFYRKVNETWGEILQALTFFSLELMALPEDFIKTLVAHSKLSNYRFYFRDLIERKPYALSEPEEKIINSKSLTGRKAFLSLYDELMGSLAFPLNIGGKCRTLNIDQVKALSHSPDRSLRERAFQALFEELARHGMIFRNILNALLQDYQQEGMIRGYPSPMSRMHLSNAVKDSIIKRMVDAVEEHYPLARKYLRIKARLLGLRKMKDADILASLKKANIRVSFSDARQIILDAMAALHPLFHSAVYDLFDKKRIDAEVRQGKKDGAFCKCLSPSQCPFISMSYTGDIKDILILAHELGHGIHYILASEQSYLNFSPPPILGETASTFFEIIVACHLIKKKQYRISGPLLIAKQAEQILITVFRQNVLTRFEEKIHRLSENQLLSEAEICRIWQEENRRLYGDDVTMMPGSQWGWTAIPHIFHRPFYCYSYIFGYLIAIVLFQNLMEKGSSFLDKIITLFCSGSSALPTDMLKEIGLNPQDRTFWEQSFQYFEGLIDSLEIVKGG